MCVEDVISFGFIYWFVCGSNSGSTNALGWHHVLDFFAGLLFLHIRNVLAGLDLAGVVFSSWLIDWTAMGGHGHFLSV